MAHETPERPTAEIGVSGLDHFSGVIDEEFLPELRGEKGRRTLREMSENDPVVGAVLFAIDMMLRQVDWRVEPASEASEDAAHAQFVEECVADMSHAWSAHISEAMTMLVYGWSYFEQVYKRRDGDNADPSRRSRFTDGRIGWRKFAIRAQDTLARWQMDEAGGVQAMVQQAAPTFEERIVPIAKALLYRTAHRKGSPEGASVLRRAYRPWYFKKRIEEIQGIGIERDLAGYPVLWAPSRIFRDDATAADQALFTSLKDIARRIKRDEQEGLVMPLEYDADGNKVYDIELLSTGGRRQIDTKAVMEYYDQRIAMTVLADFILIGHEKVGSFALSSDKTSLFAVALGAWLDEIQDVLNRHALPRLFRLNGLPTEAMPRFVHGDIESVDLTELGEYI
ncbi:MAG: phage portal protein family protein, partial [Gemmatimonadota bacterium]